MAMKQLTRKANNKSLVDEHNVRKEKIQQKRWINYPAVRKILKRLNYLYQYPRGGRMPSMLIHGQSGMGKTSLAKYYLRKHPRSYDKKKGVAHIPVLYIEIPPVVKDERDFYIEILLAVGAPFPWSGKAPRLRQLVRDILEEVGCKTLLIDELHNLLSGTPRQLRESLNALRFLSNQLQISLICFGLDSTINVIAGDDQLSNRMESHHLQPLRKKASLSKFAKEIVRHYPLYGETDFSSDELVSEILLQTGGIIGRLVPLLQEAAIYAAEKGIENINIDVLRAVGKQPPLVSMVKNNRQRR